MLLLHKNEILAAIRQNKAAIRGYGVKRIGLFGSFVRGEETADSDIDLIVQFEKGQKTYKNFIHLCFYLEELFGKKVELLTTESISQHLKPRIEKEAIYEELS